MRNREWDIKSKAERLYEQRFNNKPKLEGCIKTVKIEEFDEESNIVIFIHEVNFIAMPNILGDIEWRYQNINTHNSILKLI